MSTPATKPHQRPPVRVANKKAFARALADVGPPPCDGCRHEEQCATGLACNAFARWCQEGVVSDADWRIPNTQIYNKLFSVLKIDPDSDIALRPAKQIEATT